MAPATVPPPVGKNVPVRLTPAFHADLTILMNDGTSATNAIRTAVHAHAATVQGATITIPLDADLTADLATMARAGLTPTDAVRAALGIIAGTYANAWAAGAVPHGTAPEITECTVRPPTVATVTGT